MLWSSRDGAMLAGLVAGYVATGFVPRAWDGAIGDALFHLARPLFRRRELAHTISERVGSRLDGREAADLADDCIRLYVEDGWGRARDLHGRHSPLQSVVTGREHLAAAQAAGRGVILWVMPFCGSRVLKAALWHEGLHVVHLGRENHAAPSNSRLAQRVLSPLHRLAEARYLAGTIIMPLKGFPRVLSQLKHVLRHNGCLSMNAVGAGRQEMMVSLLGQDVRLATGPPSLAQMTGAALLPAYAVRVGRLKYEAVIESGLTSDSTTPRREYIRRAVLEFASRMERQLVRRPQDWSLWRARPRAAPGPAR